MDVVFEWIKIGGGAALIIGVVGFAFTKLLDMAVHKSLEEFKNELAFDNKRKEQAALVAELIAEWVKEPMDKTLVNKLLWEATLWLPEPEVEKLHKVFVLAEDAPNTMQMLLDIRSVIQGTPTNLKAEKITYFK
ncbi:hypothetical protein AADZ91_18395 [Colwelliaceae bacterium 6441]